MQVKRVARVLGKELTTDQVTDLGAMMAYYAVLALFPMLVFVLSMSMLVLDPNTLREGVGMATKAIPEGVRTLLVARVESLISSSGAGLAIGGAILALWGASRGAVGLMTALNRIHGVDETRSFIRKQLTAILVTLAVAILGIAGMSLLLIGPVVGHWLADRFGLGALFDVGWAVGRWVGAALLVLLVLAIVYRFLPNTHARFRLFTPGAIVGLVVWLAVSALFGLYLRNFGKYEATYGALGGAIIFLTWLWLSSVALLIGAELNDVLRRHGSPKLAARAGTAEPHPTPA